MWYSHLSDLSLVVCIAAPYQTSCLVVVEMLLNEGGSLDGSGCIAWVSEDLASSGKTRNHQTWVNTTKMCISLRAMWLILNYGREMD